MRRYEFCHFTFGEDLDVCPNCHAEGVEALGSDDAIAGDYEAEEAIRGLRSALKKRWKNKADDSEYAYYLLEAREVLHSGRGPRTPAAARASAP
jgi:hypothetical protein